MEPLFDLAITLPPLGTGDLMRSLHRQLRDAILDGRLQPALRLPSTRTLAATLGISRNTVLAAYDLLLGEGYLSVRSGSGTYVARIASLPSRPKTIASEGLADARLNAFWRDFQPVFSATKRDSCLYDLREGLPDKSAFPFAVWRRLSARSLRMLSKTSASYAEPEGREALREAITKHISYARAVSCRAENVVVTAGAQQAIDLLARILVTPRQTVFAIEDPGYPPARTAFAAAGAEIVSIPVDSEGLMVERLPDDTKIVYVTPSHQSPLGVTLSARRRAALLDFAQSRGAVVIEDDYDGEFRCTGRPLDALQTLDRHATVFYVGTFSKNLFPALRLGFVVAPAWATPALITAKTYTDWHSAVLAQDTLTAFIEEGHLVRHIRKMQKIYAERRRELQRALAAHCGDRLRPMGADAGLHLAAELALPLQAGDLAAQAGLAGVRLHALERYAHRKPAQNVLLMGYGMIPAEQIDAAIRRLAQTMDGKA